MAKKIFTLLTCLVMLTSSFSALADIARVSEEPLEFTFWAAYNPTYQSDWEKMKCWAYLEEATGVHINWVLYANTDEMKEKLGILLASADTAAFPDAFFRTGISDSQLKKYGPEGLFLDMRPLVDEFAPNLSMRLTDMNAWAAVTDASSGAMYSTPCLIDSLASRMLPNLFLNRKMMDAVGWTGATPATTDELYDLLVLIRDMDANGNGDLTDEVGITSNSLSRMLNLFSGAFGINNRGRDDLAVDADPADETKVRFVYTTEEYRAMLSYVNRLFAEKLIDPSLFSLKTSDMVALGSQNQIFGLAYSNLEAASVNAEDYVGLDTSFAGPEGYNGFNTLNSGITLGSFVISSACENPEALVKWIDNLYTLEGSTLIYFGKENVDFTYNADGLPTYTDELLSKVSADNPYDKVVSEVTCYASGGIPSWFNDATFPGAQCRGTSLTAALNMEPYVNKQAWLFNFTTEENDELSALKADIITNCHDVYRAKFITGELNISDDAVWQEYLSKVEGLGLDDMMTLYQAALDRMLAK